jgi:hypothetical protein
MVPKKYLLVPMRKEKKQKEMNRERVLHNFFSVSSNVSCAGNNSDEVMYKIRGKGLIIN